MGGVWDGGEMRNDGPETWGDVRGHSVHGFLFSPRHSDPGAPSEARVGGGAVTPSQPEPGRGVRTAWVAGLV